MEKLEKQSIMQKVSSYYPDYKFDAFMIKEWEQELDKYDFDDVYKRLSEHLKDEQNGKYPPRVHILTKNLLSTTDKQNYGSSKVECQLCHRWLPYIEYDKHFRRCSSVRYIERQYKKYHNREIDKFSLYNMPEEEFQMKYDKVVEFVKEHTEDETERTSANIYFKTKDGSSERIDNLWK